MNSDAHLWRHAATKFVQTHEGTPFWFSHTTEKLTVLNADIAIRVEDAVCEIDERLVHVSDMQLAASKDIDLLSKRVYTAAVLVGVLALGAWFWPRTTVTVCLPLFT